MRIISGEEAQSILEVESALTLIRDVYRMAAAGRADVSHPSAMHMRGALDTSTAFKIKGAVLDDLGVAGFRLIGDADERHPEDARNPSMNVRMSVHLRSNHLTRGCHAASRRPPLQRTTKYKYQPV